MSFVVRVIRLGVENLFISSIEKDITRSYTLPLSLLDRPAASLEKKKPTQNAAAKLPKAQPIIFAPASSMSPISLPSV